LTVLPKFLKTVGWFLVVAGILAGVYLGDEFVSSAPRAVMLSGLSLAIGVGLGTAVPGLILIGLGEIVAAIRESTAATLALGEHLTGSRWRRVYAASRQEDDEDQS
jgi:hypothetical protein